MTLNVTPITLSIVLPNIMTVIIHLDVQSEIHANYAG